MNPDEAPQKSHEQRGTFEDLLKAEAKTFGDASTERQTIAAAGKSKEPWVSFTTRDRLGLAFSGGGIRSATFNLGILQALAEKKIITHADYLATVSGGGYAGGFWTRWRRRLALLGQTTAGFPTPPQTAAPNSPKEIRESPQLRHLREFSRFLIPRKGLNGEFWSVAITVLAGIIPSLMAAVASILLLTTVWALAAAGLTGSHTQLAGVLSAAAISASLLVLLRGALRREGREDCHVGAQVLYALLSGALYLGSWLLLPRLLDAATKGQGLRPFGLFAPCLALLGTLAVLTLLKLLISRFVHPHAKPRPAIVKETESQQPEGKRLAWSSCLNRTMGYLLAMQALWAVMAGLWLVADALFNEAQAANKELRVGGVGGLVVTFSFLFYKVRDWLKQQKESEQDSTLSKLLKVLKPYVPLLLANGVLLLLILLASVTLLTLRPPTTASLQPWWTLLGYCAGLLLIVFFLFDPSGQGLHEFYRGRLARCFLGAAASEPTHEWAERDDDDMPLSDDRNRPIHLICCAANQASGDPLLTLHRGARSAVLSRNGVSVGNTWITDNQDKPLRLSSAMTASAAAFNSLMGEFNVTLGHAVPFVMSALNLRLGLWVRNPGADERWSWLYRWFPGAFFVREMLGLAGSDEKAGPYIHLSDGGHFENLALYELIRRHCRYIIVSDAAEDKDFAFADFGRAVRRVREDFGVEIEIDLARLRPNDKGLSAQHLAVGVIHYDGVVGTDKGTLVYVKSSLSGDEPADVLQYQKLSETFPHESTGDQFFDEAQFESYRRLGEHIVHSALRSFEGRTLGVNLKLETLFHELRLQWQVVPWIDSEVGVRLCQRGSDLELALAEEGNRRLGLDFLNSLLSQPTEKEASESSAKPELQAPLERELLLVLQILRFMEEAYVAFSLDSYWSNPRAQSWMSLLHRYAAMPALRHWWPLLKPLLGVNFVEFANEHLALRSADSIRSEKKTQSDHPRLSLKEATPPVLGSYLMSRCQACLPGYSLAGRRLSILSLELPSLGPRPAQSLEVGFIAFHEEVHNGRRSYVWQIEELFVPPELKGGKFTSVLLDSFIEEAGRDKTLYSLRVTLGVGQTAPVHMHRLQRGQAARLAQVEHIDFHRSRNFRFDGTTWEMGQNVCMEHILANAQASQPAQA
jgi:hypothetical protein